MAQINPNICLRIRAKSGACKKAQVKQILRRYFYCCSHSCFVSYVFACQGFTFKISRGRGAGLPRFLAPLPGFAQLLNTGATRFYKITLSIPQWHLTFFAGFAA